MKIKIEGIEPKPCPRPRLGKFGVYTPRVYQLFKREIAAAGLKEMKGAPPMDKVPLKVSMDFYCTCKNILSRRSGDIDNLAKSVMDGLTGVIWKDDSIITDCRITKRHCETPLIIIEVEEINTDEQ